MQKWDRPPGAQAAAFQIIRTSALTIGVSLRKHRKESRDEIRRRPSGREIGLLFIGDVLRANLVEQDQQLESPNALASWEYDANWRWDPKKITLGLPAGAPVRCRRQGPQTVL